MTKIKNRTVDRIINIRYNDWEVFKAISAMTKKPAATLVSEALAHLVRKYKKKHDIPKNVTEAMKKRLRNIKFERVDFDNERSKAIKFILGTSNVLHASAVRIIDKDLSCRVAYEWIDIRPILEEAFQMKIKSLDSVARGFMKSDKHGVEAFVSVLDNRAIPKIEEVFEPERATSIKRDWNKLKKELELML